MSSFSRLYLDCFDCFTVRLCHLSARISLSALDRNIITDADDLFVPCWPTGLIAGLIVLISSTGKVIYSTRLAYTSFPAPPSPRSPAPASRPPPPFHGKEREVYINELGKIERRDVSKSTILKHGLAGRRQYSNDTGRYRKMWPEWQRRGLTYHIIDKIPDFVFLCHVWRSRKERLTHPLSVVDWWTDPVATMLYTSYRRRAAKRS